jgi:hypothetical protein
MMPGLNAPMPAGQLPAGQLPVGQSPYAANYAPYGGMTPVGGLTPASAFQPQATLQTMPQVQPQTQLPLVSAYRPFFGAFPNAATGSPIPAGNFWGSSGMSPTVTANRPALLDNPSVYTGQPVNSLGYAPDQGIANQLRGVSPATNFGATNTYPTTDAYATGYGSYRLGTAAPASAYAANPYAAGAYTANRPTLGGGLQRFFGSLFGTNYQTSYYTAPTTYYRPAQMVDPMTGTTITTQRPCTGYEQLVQRTPISGLQPFTNVPAGAVPVGPPVLMSTQTCGDGTCNTSAMGAAGGLDPFGSVAQASAMQPIGEMTPLTDYGQSTSPLVRVPSGYNPYATAMDAGQSMTQSGSGYAPLTQSPVGQAGYQAGDDYTPMEQPRLDEAPRAQFRASPELDRGSRYEDDLREQESARDEELRLRDEELRLKDELRLKEESRIKQDDYRSRQPSSKELREKAKDSYWGLPRDEDTTAMVRPRSQNSDLVETTSRFKTTAPATPPSLGGYRSEFVPGLGSSVEPIRGLDTDTRKRPSTSVAPSSVTPSSEAPRSDRYRTLVAPPLVEGQATVERPSFERPSFEGQSYNRQSSGRQTQDAKLRDVELHEVGLVRYEEPLLPTRREVTAPKPVQRDATWKPVR